MVIKALRAFGVPFSPTDRLDTLSRSPLPPFSCYPTRKSTSSPYTVCFPYGALSVAIVSLIEDILLKFLHRWDTYSILEPQNSTFMNHKARFLPC